MTDRWAQTLALGHLPPLWPWFCCLTHLHFRALTCGGRLTAPSPWQQGCLDTGAQGTHGPDPGRSTALASAPQPGPQTGREVRGSPVGSQHHRTASPGLLQYRPPQVPLGAGIHPGAGLVLKERAHDGGCCGCALGHAGCVRPGPERGGVGGRPHAGSTDKHGFTTAGGPRGRPTLLHRPPAQNLQRKTGKRKPPQGAPPGSVGSLGTRSLPPSGNTGAFTEPLLKEKRSGTA